MAVVESKLKQTKNAFKVVGKVTRIDKDGAWKEEVMSKGKMEGQLYRSLKFGVKTSDSNEITVSMFDFEPTEVFLWNSDKRKADPSYKGEKIPFGQWENNQEELREQGFAVLQTRVGVTYKDDGKIDSKGLPSFVASQEIYENINNGDYVAIEGTIRYSTYKNNQEKIVEQKTYTITKLHKIKDVDFESAEFEEVTYFEQDMVFVGADHDRKEGKVYVTGRHINYNKSFHDTQMVVNYKNEDGTNDEGMLKLAEAFAKKFKFGDLISVFGDTLNRVIVSEVEDDGANKEKDNLLASLGGKSKPKHAQSYTSRTYVTEMSIHGIEDWQEGFYTEDDFIVDNLIEEKKNPFADEFGGKAKKKNPFEDEKTIDINDEDLPF